MTDAGRRSILRLLWVVVGSLDHNLDVRRNGKLYQIYMKYKQLDLVPEGYMYAEFHMHTEAPLHVR